MRIDAVRTEGIYRRWDVDVSTVVEIWEEGGYWFSAVIDHVRGTSREECHYSESSALDYVAYLLGENEEWGQ